MELQQNRKEVLWSVRVLSECNASVAVEIKQKLSLMKEKSRNINVETWLRGGGRLYDNVTICPVHFEMHRCKDHTVHCVPFKPIELRCSQCSPSLLPLIAAKLEQTFFPSQFAPDSLCVCLFLSLTEVIYTLKLILFSCCPINFRQHISYVLCWAFSSNLAFTFFESLWGWL